MSLTELIGSVTTYILYILAFLYASLRLRLTAIWPLMLMHGFWDFSIFVLQSTHAPDNTEDISVMKGLSVSVPALLYGIFVYWRWSKQNSILQK